MNFSETLEKILKEKGITQTELAEVIGIRRPTISDWKKNGSVPTADVAFKIADYLNVSCRWLVTGIEENGISNSDRALLQDFHDLTEDQQESILMMIQGYKAKNENAKKEIG